MSLKDDILGADDLPRERLEIPEWGITVYVSTMSAYERDAFETESFALKDKKDERSHLRNFRARFAVRVLVDEEGNRIFSNEDAEALGRKSSRILSRIYDAGAPLNGLNEDAVEDMAKNSNGEATDDSISG